MSAAEWIFSAVLYVFMIAVWLLLVDELYRGLGGRGRRGRARLVLLAPLWPVALPTVLAAIVVKHVARLWREAELWPR